jgi:hypothetical protein
MKSKSSRFKAFCAFQKNKIIIYELTDRGSLVNRPPRQSRRSNPYAECDPPPLVRVANPELFQNDSSVQSSTPADDCCPPWASPEPYPEVGEEGQDYDGLMFPEDVDFDVSDGF